MIKIVLVLLLLISMNFAEVRYPTQQEFINKIQNQEFDHLIVENGFVSYGVLKGNVDTLYSDWNYSLENILVKDMIDNSNTRLVVIEDDSPTYYLMQEVFFLILTLLFCVLLGIVIYKQNQILKVLRNE